MAIVLVVLVVFIAYGVLCYLVGLRHGEAEVREWRDAAKRTPRRVHSPEQFLEDLRGAPARRDRRWFARWRRDRKARQRRPRGEGNRWRT